MTKAQDAWYQANKERLKKKSRERYWEKREEILAQQAEYQRTHPEVRRASVARWRKNHPDRHAEQQQRRRALYKGKALTLLELIHFYGEFCMFPGCENMNLTVDHVVPLSLGGEHAAHNQQLLCASHNSSKGNRSSDDYRPVVVV